MPLFGIQDYDLIKEKENMCSVVNCRNKNQRRKRKYGFSERDRDLVNLIYRKSRK